MSDENEKMPLVSCDKLKFKCLTCGSLAIALYKALVAFETKDKELYEDAKTTYDLVKL